MIDKAFIKDQIDELIRCFDWLSIEKNEDGEYADFSSWKSQGEGLLDNLRRGIDHAYLLSDEDLLFMGVSVRPLGDRAWTHELVMEFQKGFADLYAAASADDPNISVYSLISAVDLAVSVYPEDKMSDLDALQHAQRPLKACTGKSLWISPLPSMQLFTKVVIVSFFR